MAVKKFFLQQWPSVKPYLPYAFFVAVALMLLWPLLPPGFILTLDMVFAPHISEPDHITSSYAFYMLLHILNSVVPADLLQKIMLVLLLSSSGIGMYQLVKYLALRPGEAAAMIASLAYMVNPFVYSRFMAGQFAVLLGYACLPFFIKNFLQLIANPTTKNAAWVAGWLTIIGVLSIHTLALCAVVIVVGVLAMTVQRRNIVAVLLASLTAIVMFTAASFYWLLPLVLGESTTAQAIRGFTNADQAAFVTVGNSLAEQLINIAGLQGFWADARALYVLPQQAVASWPVITVGIWLLVGYGAVVMRRRKADKTNIYVVAFSALAGAVLATTLLSQLLASFPLAMGMREPHKFVGLVAVAFAIFIGSAGASLVSHAAKLYKDKRIAMAALGCVLLVPFAWTPTMLGGMYGQLQPRSYPSEWFTANDFLNADNSTFQALFLPWHGYQRFDFSGRIIMNPAEKFFDKPMLASNELEFRGAAPTFPDQTKSYIAKTLLPQAPNRRDLAEKLNDITIKYIVVAKEDTGSEYLVRQPGIKLVFNTAKIKIYQNMQFSGGQK